MSVRKVYSKADRSLTFFGPICLPRAPDWWNSPLFQAVSWLKVGPAITALSRPTHQRVTLAVGWLGKEKFL